MKKDARYESAYASDEFRKWVASMSPQERERARAAGLLSPQYDKQERWRERTDIDALPARLAPREDARDLEEIAVEAFERDFPNKEIYERVRRYLDGEGTLEALASELGMSKQRLAYHVRRYQKELGLPPAPFQKSEAAREKFRTLNFHRNKRGDNLELRLDERDHEKIRTWQAFKFARRVRRLDPRKLSLRDLLHLAALISAIAESREKFVAELSRRGEIEACRNPAKMLPEVARFASGSHKNAPSLPGGYEQQMLF